MNYQKPFAILTLIFCLAAAPGVVAAGIPAETRAAIESTLTNAIPGVPYRDLTETPIDGLYQVSLEGGAFLFVTADGDYMISGELYRSGEDGLVNLSEDRRREERKDLLAEVPVSEMIVFAPEGDTRAVLNVFTDVDCGYCRKLHQEVPALNEKGVEIRYLAFPRGGVGSPGYRRIASAWCHKNPQQALTALKSGEEIAIDVCEDNPVAREFALGEKMGVRGTPALVLADGTMIPGYRPADELVEMLGLE